MTEPCNCEHVEHAEGVGHAYLSVPSSPSWTAMYVGKVCTECGMGHMRDYLVTLGPYMEDGRFIQNTWFELQGVMPLTKREMEILFDEN